MTKSQTEFKDLFSHHAQAYALFRPTYPKEVFSYLASLCEKRNLAWDCGTGNGQAAIEIANHFDHVIATDPSEKQLLSAVRHPKIKYEQAKAESSPLAKHSADLITVAQAFHWFDHEKFFNEVRRTAKSNTIFAIWCYAHTSVTPAIDAVIWRLYKNVLDDYWEPERRLVESGYKTIPVPFTEIDAPKFSMTAEWSCEQLMGYIQTWSALQKYAKQNSADPLEIIKSDLKTVWQAHKTRTVSWELFLRVFRI